MVEELGRGGLVLREVRVVSAFVPLLVVVDHVVGLRGEELVELVVLEDGVQDVDLVHGWLSTLVSDSCEHGESSEGEMNFPDEGLGEHQEAEGGPSKHNSGPSIV